MSGKYIGKIDVFIDPDEQTVTFSMDSGQVYQKKLKFAEVPRVMSPFITNALDAEQRQTNRIIEAFSTRAVDQSEQIN